MRQGVIPSHMIETMVASGQILVSEPLQDDQVQPASLDLRLGTTAYRVRASFLAGHTATVAEGCVNLRCIELACPRVRSWKRAAFILYR